MVPYNRARWYEPESGRFISTDPIEEGANWYAYAGNDPVNFRDPSGLSQAGNPLNALAGGFSGNTVSTISNAFRNPGQVFNGIGNAIGQASNFLGNALNSGISTLTSSLGTSQSTISTSTSSSFGFPVNSINYGPIPTRSQATIAEFNTFSNTLAAEHTARARADFARLDQRIGEIARTPTTLGLDRLGDLAFAEIGNASRSLGNGLASGIEYATSGFGGSVGNAVAGIGGGLAQLSRTAGNVGAALDLPRTIQSTIADIDQSIQIGRERGFRLGVGNLIGTNQIAQFAVGNDFNGQAVDVNTLSNGILRLSGTAGTGAGTGRLLARAPVAPVRASAADDLFPILNQDFVPRQRTAAELRGLAEAEVARLRATGLTSDQIGPVVSIAQDARTGQLSSIYNNDYFGRLPVNLNQQIASRLRGPIPLYRNTKGAGSHAEIFSANELLNARSSASFNDLRILTINTQQKVQGTIRPPCRQCGFLLDGAEYLRP